MTSWWVDELGRLYQGDMRPGDRAATTEEINRVPTLEEQVQALKVEIEALEVQHMLPRIAREFMLQTLELSYAPEQLAQNIAYVRLKELNDIIGAKRQRLSDLQGQLG